MSRHYKYVLSLILSLYTGLSLTVSAAKERPLDLVDTRVGSDAATTATAGLFGKGSEEHGQTIPAVTVPNGMNFWTPQTRDTEQKCIAPYYYSDSRLQGFRNSHWLVGGCTQDYGSMTLMPLGKSLRMLPEERGAIMDKNTETAAPDYYSVFLPDEGLQTEMTGTSRAGIFRFTYTEDGKGWLTVFPNSDEGEGWIEIDPERNEIRGCNPVHRIYQGWGEPAGFSGWFIIKLDPAVKITRYGVSQGGNIYPGENTLRHAPQLGAFIEFDRKKDTPVIVKAASSFTSLDGAISNLEAEIPGWDFDEVRKATAGVWDDRFDLITVEGGKETDRRKFYGSMYRASLLPRTMNDVDGSYPTFSEREIKKLPAGRTYYDDFSMWDTYRALHPLITLLTPEVSGDMMNSLIMKASVKGWLPIFPCWNSYTAAMIGDHCIAAIADAAVKGVDNFDLREAYKYMRRNAFEMPADRKDYVDGMGRRALDSYLKFGYIPAEDSVPDAFHKREQTSRTLEYAFDDYALSRVAGLLGEEADRKELEQRAGNWRNVIDPELGYANVRFADGHFAEGTNPFDFNKGITEGAPCHYTWYVPHDPDGLIEVLGGHEAFVEKLDSMFTEKRYWHGNEPCHQVVYLFDYAGAPEKTQKWVRHIMDTEYEDTPGGLSGNDDAGQMSAWFIFSAMGFYPVTPAKEEYALGSPLFDRITIRPKGGKIFRIIADNNSEENIYIEDCTLNGQGYDSRILPHRAITSGGELRLQMKSTP